MRPEDANGTGGAVTVVTEFANWPARSDDTNKGTYGRVLVIAGSRGMSGAAVLAGRACLRGGAGLVRVACPRETQPIIAAGEPCLMTVPLVQDDAGCFAAEAYEAWKTLAMASDVVALGPGLGRSPVLDDMVARFVAERERPLVLDADGLNAMIGHRDSWAKERGPIVITPHPGEFGRLLGLTTAQVQADRSGLAVAFAREAGAVVILKGHETIVTDGRRLYVNNTGNPGMATAGAGDILTGLLAAMLGQNFSPFDAAQLGVNLHGLAGDMARDKFGEVSMIATDLLRYLPNAIKMGHMPAFF